MLANRRVFAGRILPALVAAVVVLLAGGAFAAREETLPDETRRTVVGAFAEALERNFVDASAGRRYAAELMAKEGAGAYRNLSARALAETATRDVQALAPDGHLRLAPPSPNRPLGTPSAKREEEESAETGIGRSGWLAGGIAYIHFDLFPSSKGSMSALAAFLETHANARALILDLRTHGGGYTDEIDLIASHLFTRPVELMQFDTREAAFRPKPDTPQLVRIAGPAGVVRQSNRAVPPPKPRGLAHATVYVLTSGYTGSAAEHLALALKLTGRATLVGETTAGMGHFGRIIELPAGFTAIVPIGRPFDPATGQGWEGTGVAPQIAAPAEAALATALLRLGLGTAEARRLARMWQPAGSMKRVVPLRSPD